MVPWWDGSNRDAASCGRLVSVCDPGRVEQVIREAYLYKYEVVGSASRSPTSQMFQSVETRGGGGWKLALVIPRMADDPLHTE